MAVSPGYLLDKPPPPPAWKVFLDLRVLPALIDAAGSVEGALELVSAQGRSRPARAVGVALGIGYALGWSTMARRARSRADYF